MKRLLFVILFIATLAHATSFNVTAVRIDGNGTVPAALSGVGTLSSGTLTASSGTFTSGEVGSGIIFNGVVCGITAFTSSTVVTISAPCANATAQAWTVLTSACYNSVTKSCNGWVAEIDISTVATGGTYALGLSQANNNNPTNAAIVFTVTSKGYTSAGAATTYTRTCYGTKPLRQAYPTGTVNDEVSSGGTFTTRVAISCLPYDVPIFASDTVTVAIGAGFYTDGSSNTNNSFSGSVTNNSTLSYSVSRALFNWTYPGWQRVTGAFNVRGTGMASSASNGLPFARVLFTASDAHNNVATTAVTVPTIDPTLGDKAPIVEYIANMAVASFTNHDQLTVCYRAYPWIGDETAVLDSCDQTVVGAVTSGTCVANEQVKQATTNVLAYLDNIPLGTNAPSMIIGSIISQSSTANSSNTWTGQTSGCVITPTAAPTLVNAQPTPLYSPQYYLLDTTNNYSAAAYVDGSATYPGSHTSGTFVAGEKVTQSTSSAVAYLIDVTGANGSGPIHIGQIVSGTPNSTNGSTWTGATSGAVFTQTAGGTNAGSDSNSCAEAESSWPGTQPSPCATINGAMVKMAAFNNASSTPTHNDGAGTMYLAQGYYNWTGASAAVSTTSSKAWLTVTPTTGLTQSQVVIDQSSGLENFSNNNVCTSGLTTCGTYAHLKNLTVLVATSPTSDFDQNTFLWFDNVSFKDNGGTAPIYRDTIVYWTDSAIPSTVGGNSLAQFSNVNMAPAIIRGNDLTTVIGANTSTGIPIYVVVGNTNTASNTCFLTNEPASATAPASIIPILAFNTFYKCSVASASNVALTQTTTTLIGEAVFGNLFENVATNENASMWKFSADSSTSTPVYNAVISHNTVVGGRMNRAYASGDAGGNSQYIPVLRVAWAEIANIVDELAIKTDTFAGTGFSGARDANWYEVNAGGVHFDLYPDLTGGTTGWPSSGTDCMEFGGLYSYQPTITSIGNLPANCNTNTTINYPSYKNRLAYDGTNGNGGGGDYDLLSNSPAVNFVLHGAQTLPYDLAGQLYNNSGWGSAGAFEQAKILSGVFSF